MRQLISNSSSKLSSPFVEKLENLGYMSLLNINDEVHPQLLHSFYANFKKVEPLGWIEANTPQ